MFSSQAPTTLLAVLPAEHRDPAAWRSVEAVADGRRIAINEPTQKYPQHELRFYATGKGKGIGFGVFAPGSDEARLQLDDVLAVTVHTTLKRRPLPSITVVKTDGKAIVVDDEILHELAIVGLPGGRSNDEKKTKTPSTEVRLNARNRGFRLGDIVARVAPGAPPKALVLIAAEDERTTVSWSDVIAPKELHHVKKIRRGLSYSRWI